MLNEFLYTIAREAGAIAVHGIFVRRAVPVRRACRAFWAGSGIFLFCCGHSMACVVCSCLND